MKTFYAAIILFLAAITALGQESTTLIGIDAGPSLTHIRNKENDELKATLGFAAGVSLEFFLNENMGLKTGLLFEQKGAKDEITDFDGETVGDVDIDIEYQYLVVPVLFAYHTGGNPDFYVNLGPYAGFLLSNMVYYEDTDQFEGRKEDFTSETNAVDVGASIGIGANVPVGENLKLSVEIRENLGLTKTIGDSKTNSIGLLVGLKYTVN